MNNNTTEKLKEGLIDALPIMLGYLPIAMAFGLLSKNTQISFRDTSLFSIMVYAGASQFMALYLIMGGVSSGGIILTTFLLNLRHLMMSASLSVSLKGIKSSYLPLIAFGITDETFSVASFNREKLSLPYILIFNISSYLSWVFGTMAGFLVGEILPQSLQSSLSIGLYAMFAALLFPEFKKSKNVLFLSILSAFIYGIIYYTNIISTGWDIIIGIILSSFLGVLIFQDKGDDSN